MARRARLDDRDAGGDHRGRATPAARLRGVAASRIRCTRRLIGLRLLAAGGAAGSRSGGFVALSAGEAALLAGGRFVAGVESSLLGVSGGVIIVPFLVLLLGYSQHLAEGTSLAVIVPTVLAGAARHARNGYTEWGLGLRLGVCASLGAPRRNADRPVPE